MSIRRSHQIRKAVAWTRREKRPWAAKIGDADGTIEVPGSPGLWYVRPTGHDLAFPVYRGSAPRLRDYPVWVGQDVYNRRWIRILGTNLEGLSGNGGVTPSEIGPHGETHYLTGADPAYFSTRQITELLLTVVSGMTIRIAGGFVVVGGQPAYISTQNIDLTSHIPGNGATWVLIRADDAGALTVQDGTNEDSFADLTVQNIPAVEDGYAAPWAVRLYDGQTAVNASTTAPDFFDLRFAPMTGGGALADHDHSGDAGDGGQLDWDNIWSDAVHSHGSDAEGGTLDWDNVWSDAVHDHSSNAEGGTIALNGLSDVDTTGTITGDVIYNSGSGWVDYPLGIGSKITVDGNKLRFGNVSAGNYIDIDTTSGNLRLLGDATVFRDHLQSLIGQKLESPASDITQNDAEASLTFSDGCTLSDYVSMNVQLNHDWKTGSDIFPHLHWWQASADVPNWLLQYRWQQQGAAKTTAWTDVAYDEHIFTYSAGTLNQITTFGAVTPPEGAGLSDIVQFRILRDTDDDSGLFGDPDPLSGDVDAVNFDIHYEIDGWGSDEEYIKDATAALLLESGDYLLLENGDNLLIE